jgi:hypothetical protein
MKWYRWFSGRPQEPARDADKTENVAIMGVGRMGFIHLSILERHPSLKVTTVAGGKSLIAYAISSNVTAYEAYFNSSSASLSQRSVASESISPSETAAYVLGLGIRFIVSGAFSRQHIKETMELIRGGFRV